MTNTIVMLNHNRILSLLAYTFFNEIQGARQADRFVTLPWLQAPYSKFAAKDEMIHGGTVFGTKS